jgi:hypothetical protein
MATSGGPPLTVIIPAAHPWPAVESTLASLVPQMARVGGEVIVVSGVADALPTPPPPGVRPLILDSRDAFVLRLAAMQTSVGAIVAIGEDHVLYCDDWVEQLLHAFADHPDGAGFMGSVSNGKTGALDRASFWVTLAPWSAPMATLSLDRTPVPGNLAVRRTVIDGLLEPGRFEYEIVPRLLATGGLRGNDRQRVVHDQSLGTISLGTIGSWLVHFASGRAYGAADGRGSRWRRVREAVRAPGVILEQTRSAWRAPGRTDDTFGCQILVAALGVTNGLGQITGIFFGPGQSGSRIV